ncbi:cytochrome P450 [soil metagenome]
MKKGFIPPYPKPMPNHGKWLNLLTRPAKFLRSRRCSLSQLTDASYSMQMGEVRLPMKRLYIANQPELVQRILVDDAPHFPKSGIIADMLELLMGDSIFVSNGEVWKRQRRMMDPAFEQARIKVVFDLMMEAVDALTARLDALPNASACAIDVEMTHVTADIIFRTIFSHPIAAHEAHLIYEAFIRFQETAFTHGMTRTMGFPSLFTYFRQRRAKTAAAEIRGVLDPIIKTRFDSFHKGEPQTHQDILQTLISVKDSVTGTHFDFRELCEQVAMLFLAGHETSASSLSWALYLLSEYPGIQERAHQEAVSVVGEGRPKFSHVKRLGLIRNIFAEALRLYPPVAFLPRTAAVPVCMRDKEIKAGAMISISPWLLHRHRRHWKEPDSFDPDRFDRDDTVTAQRQAYLPFSKGPRVCLGASFALQEAALILVTLVKRYRLDPVPGFAPKPIGRLTVRSENGIRLIVTRRSPAS